MNMPITADTVQFVTAVTALVAVIVGPTVSLYISRNQNRLAKAQLEVSTDLAMKQIRAATVSAARREWLDQLRRDVVALLSLSTNFGVPMTIIPLSVDDVRKFMEPITERIAMISLSLNPEEPLHCELAMSIRGVNDAVVGMRAAYQNEDEEARKTRLKTLTEAFAEVRKTARPVLKAEWEKVKAVE